MAEDHVIPSPYIEIIANCEHKHQTLYDRMLFVIALCWHKRHLAVDESYELHAKSVKAQVSNDCHYHSWHTADATFHSGE